MRIDHPFLIVLILCAFAGITAMLLQPKPGVQLEGEIAMLEPAEALKQLDATLGKVDFQRNLVLTHAALALDAGEFSVVQNVLRAQGGDGTDSVEIASMLAEASRLSGDPAGEIVHLAAAYALDPSATIRQKLGLAYRTNRQIERERELLQSVSAEDLTSFEARRLADLLRQNSDFVALESLYHHRADGDGPNADEAKQLLINFDLEAGRPQDALRRALVWFNSSDRDRHILQTVVPAFVNWDALDEAMSLALAMLDVSPASAYVLITVFLDGGHQDRAFAFQAKWLEKVQAIPNDAWPTLIDTAKRTGNLGGLRSALAMSQPERLSAEQLSRVLIIFLRYQGIEALFPYAAYLRPDVLTHQPLIAAAWAASQGNQVAATGFLLDAQKGELTDWDWNIWGYIAGRMQGSPAYQSLLAKVPAEGRARSLLTAAFMANASALPEAELVGTAD